MKPVKLLIALLLALLPSLMRVQADTTVFALLDLTRPGLERVAELHAAGDDKAAAEALLDYYRHRTGVVCPDADPAGITITPEEQRWADEAMEHRFFVHKGYQPSYFYGDDIDWEYWPVKDNELRWQLHRMKWWVPMGKAYRLSGDERYAAEWCAEYLDWMRKNPLTAYDERKAGNWTQAENVYFAWRPLEVSDRLEFQIHQFLYFLPAEAFDADFLLHFLENYHRHAEHITRHFSAKGNHLLFEAQRMLFAGIYFPEFREAAEWRRSGIEILNREIGVQVYPDGMQFELDFGYHIAAIDIFLKALGMASANGYESEFPASYVETVGKMTVVTWNLLFPDYSNPMFGDTKSHDKSSLQRQFRSWSKVFPDDKQLQWFATEGRKGALPDYTSQQFPASGFYVLRTGWDKDAAVTVVKAGPLAFWHNQPDNGTFDYWRRGRNFFPDSGSYVYGGDSAVLAQRNWFRQTRVHNTVTLDDRDLEKTDSKLLLWKATPELTTLVTENPSYEGLTHRRAMFFTAEGLLVIADQVSGTAAGKVGVHFNLCPGRIEYAKDGTVRTLFADGNNIRIKTSATVPVQIREEEGWVSTAYRKKEERPAYAVEAQKDAGGEMLFVTVIAPDEAPFQGSIAIVPEKAPVGDTLRFAVRVGAKTYELGYELR